MIGTARFHLRFVVGVVHDELVAGVDRGISILLLLCGLYLHISLPLRLEMGPMFDWGQAVVNNA